MPVWFREHEAGDSGRYTGGVGWMEVRGCTSQGYLDAGGAPGDEVG